MKKKDFLEPTFGKRSEKRTRGVGERGGLEQ